MKHVRSIVVTGSNKGIGLGIARHFAKCSNWNVIMAIRNIQLGKKARDEIIKSNPDAKVSVQLLDISNTQSIDNFISLLKNKYHSIDVLINNAGVKANNFDTSVFDFTFQTNFYGTVDISQKIIPILSENGKIITLGSIAGKVLFNQLKSQQLKNKYRKPQLTRDELFALAQQFRAAIADKTTEEKGWPKSIYGISKLNINIYCSVLARYEDILQKGIQVYSCCPGYVATDMSNYKGTLTVDQGILTPVYLTELPFKIDQKLQGQFFQKQKLSSTFEDLTN